MNEVQRQAYLQLMQIDSYFPRSPLPGAKPSVSVSVAVEPVAVSAPETRNDEPVQFTLRYYRVNADLAVMDETPHAGGQQDDRRERALLVAILRALGVNFSELELAGEFAWPVTGHRDLVEKGAGAAWRGLDGYLHGRQASHGFNSLVVFAGGCAKLINSHLEVKSGHRYWPGLEMDITVTQSLNAILTVPTLKRGVWQDLQPLYHSLRQARQDQENSA
ncbi:MAG: hypothetical protein WDZ76_04250 [Pseudohongiellaceae bacterium]